MKKPNQGGNAVILVLLGIVLFAALAYTLVNSAKTGQGNLTKNQAKTIAIEILGSADFVAKAVNKIRGRGCSENQISAQRDWNGDSVVTDVAGDLYNSNSPTDKSCHIFETAGGSVTYQRISNYDYRISGSALIDTIGCSAGATCAELTYAILGLTKQICDEINIALQLNLSSPPTDAEGMSEFNTYTGTFTAAGVIGNSDVNLSGRRQICYQDNSGTTGYIFYSVLMER